MDREHVFNTLQLLIFHENTVVTYKLLSRELEMHINVAKYYMLEYFNEHKEDLKAFYFLSGIQENSDASELLKTTLVSEENLVTAKQQFKTVIGCHLYSLNKGKPVNDITLYSTEHIHTKNAEHQIRYSAIQNSSVKSKQPKIVFSSVENVATTSAVSTKVAKQEVKSPPSKSNGINSLWQKKDTQTSKSEVSPHHVGKSDLDTKKNESPGGNIEPQKEEKAQKRKTPTKADTKGKKKSPQITIKESTKNSLLNMFSRQAEKANSKTTVKAPAPKKVVQKVEQGSTSLSKMESTQQKKHDSNTKSVNHDPEIKNDKKNIKSESKKRKVANKQKKQKSKAVDSDSDNDFKPKRKKHKRICTFDSDSESECEEAEDRARRIVFDEEDPLSVPMEMDDEEPIPPTPQNCQGKKKIWKTITKTYQDEDGFFVTKKEKELVSASEESDAEGPLKVNKKVVQEPVKKTTSINKKQASLTSFFRQK